MAILSSHLTEAASISKMPIALAPSQVRQKSNVRKFLDAGVAGAISCSCAHSIVVPLDVIKTKIQVEPAMSGKSVGYVFTSLIKGGGKSVLLQGLAATFSGYFMQGFCKFGFYDLFKSKMYSSINDDEKAETYRIPILLASSGLAEIIASWALCPMEATRIYMVMNPEISKAGMLFALNSLLQRDGVGGLFKGLPLIMLRQIPYTCAKLAGYELISDKIKNVLWTRYKEEMSESSTSNEGLSGTMSTFIQLSSGVCAGVLAAIVSQPADVLLSKVCGGSNALTECIVIGGPMRLLRAFKYVGLKESFSGLFPRALMIGSLTAMQFFLYERVRTTIQSIHTPDIRDPYLYLSNDDLQDVKMPGRFE
jgi:solute carrier family 25 phosphate transporter 3